MDHVNQIADRIDAIARDLAQAIADHEAEDHGGGTCRSARVTALGYLAARLGVREEGQLLLVPYYCERFSRMGERAT